MSAETMRAAPAPARGRMRRLVAALAVLLLIWAAGFVWFATHLPAAVEDPATPTDAIVVLTGGSERLREGLALLGRHQARKLLVSGVYQGVEVAELMRISRGAPADFDCCVVLGYAADNTAGNAEETARWVRDENFSSLRLVTSAYHMPRSLLEFRHALPDVDIVAHPVFSTNVKHRDWWRWPGTSWLYVGEYTKYLAALVRVGVIRLFGGA